MTDLLNGTRIECSKKMCSRLLQRAYQEFATAQYFRQPLDGACLTWPDLPQSKNSNSAPLATRRPLPPPLTHRLRSSFPALQQLPAAAVVHLRHRLHLRQGGPRAGEGHRPHCRPGLPYHSRLHDGEGMGNERSRGMGGGERESFVFCFRVAGLILDS